MKRNMIMRLSLALLFVLASFATASPASAAARHDRCKDRCNDEYHARMRDCRGLRHGEKHRCEQRAKWEHKECRRRCR